MDNYDTMPWPLLVLVTTITMVSIECSAHLSWAEEPATTLRTFSLPSDPMFFKPGPGQEMANTYCLICHSADYVYTQPPHTQDKWQSLILKMKSVFGCPIPDELIVPLSAYLFGQNSVAKD